MLVVSDDLAVAMKRAARERAAAVARACRRGDELAERCARRELAALRAESALCAILAGAPALSAAQAGRLHGLVEAHTSGPTRVHF